MPNTQLGLVGSPILSFSCTQWIIELYSKKINILHTKIATCDNNLLQFSFGTPNTKFNPHKKRKE